MAFKRSRVRSSPSPPESEEFFLGFFVFISYKTMQITIIVFVIVISLKKPTGFNPSALVINTSDLLTENFGKEIVYR